MSQPAGAKGSVTKGKLILVAVLAVVLVGVIASNFKSGANVPEVAAPADQAAATAVVATNPTPESGAPAETSGAASTGPFGEFAEDAKWPGVTLEEATKFDPLAVPAWAGPPPPSDVGTGREFSEEQLTELNKAGNAIIFVSGNKRVALIGTQEFHVGDMIGGMKISDISSAGIVLSDPN